MNYRILPNGDLLITAGNQDRSELAHILRDPNQGYPGAESWVGEAFLESLTLIAPEAIGALTSAPILTDKVSLQPAATHGGLDYQPSEDAHVWWFPDYAVRDPWQELARTGRVVFSKAPEAE